MNIEALIYLWTRDGEFAVNKETEGYIVDHIQKLKNHKPQFSDQSRLAMVKRILRATK